MVAKIIVIIAVCCHQNVIAKKKNISSFSKTEKLSPQFVSTISSDCVESKSVFIIFLTDNETKTKTGKTNPATQETLLGRYNVIAQESA